MPTKTNTIPNTPPNLATSHHFKNSDQVTPHPSDTCSTPLCTNPRGISLLTPITAVDQPPPFLFISVDADLIR